MIPSEIELATFLLVAQCLFQLRHLYFTRLVKYSFTRNLLSPVLTPVYKMSLVLFEHVTVMNTAYICCEICGDMSNFPLMGKYF